MNNNHPIILGSYSPSQNGIIVHPKGIALCLTGGGKGHDVDKPKILLEYDQFHNNQHSSWYSECYHGSLLKGWRVEYPSKYKLADEGCGNIIRV